MRKPRDRKRLVHQAIAVLANPNYRGCAKSGLKGSAKCTNMQIADVSDVDEDKVKILLPDLIDAGLIRMDGFGRARIITIVKGPETIPDSMFQRVNKKNTVAQRTCLHCGDSFKSEWAGNRICRNCKDMELFKGGNMAA